VCIFEIKNGVYLQLLQRASANNKSLNDPLLLEQDQGPDHNRVDDRAQDCGASNIFSVLEV